jgi:competence protein ComEA
MQPNNKNTLRVYFTFSARERKAIYLILILTTLFFLLPHLFPYIIKPKEEILKDQVVLPDKVSSSINDRKKFGYGSYLKDAQKETTSTKLFHFDPNRANEEQWRKLGVKEKTAQTILRYLQKGGRFRVPEDLKKIWGLSPEMAQRLIPYILIQDIRNDQSNFRFVKDSFGNNLSFNKQTIDINTAIQEQWEGLKGIGPGLASRIIKFREKLGGFISIDQVKETYGLPDSTFQQIRVKLVYNEKSVTQLNINELSLEQLATHPYIRYKAARAIISYREQHGRYQSLRELENIESIAPETLHKMEKYLTTD